MNENKKSGVLGAALSIVLLFLMSAVCGYLFAELTFGLLPSFKLYHVLLMIIGLIFVYLFTVTVHEAGHLFYGLLSGYKFSSFRIASFMWVRLEDGIRFKRLSIAGTGGQCLMVPPEEQKGKMPLVLYNLGGVFANLFLAGLFAILFVIFPRVIVLSQLFLLGAMLSAFFAISNGVPMSFGGIENDGANALYLRKNPKAARAFHIQLLINAENAKGVRLRDMPPEWFELPDEEDMDNALCASLAVFACNRLFDEERFAEAGELMKKLLSERNAILGLHRNLLTLDRIFCELILNGSSASIKGLDGDSMKKFIKSMRKYPSVLRTEYAIELVYNKNEKAAQKIEQNFDLYTKNYPYRHEVYAERAFMELAKETAKDGV